jgi:hypothetical protein
LPTSTLAFYLSFQAAFSYVLLLNRLGFGHGGAKLPDVVPLANYPVAHANDGRLELFSLPTFV